jgi:ribosome-associated protein
MTPRNAPARVARRPRRRAEADETLALAVAAAQERKAMDPVVIDLRNLSDAADFFLVVSGTSDTHVRAIAEYVAEALSTEGVRPYNVEGLRGGRWVCLDFVDVVVHVFHPALRSFYQLEGLWGDAPQHRP